MPVYCFRRCADNKPFTRTLTVGQWEALPRTEGGNVVIEGVKAYRDFQTENAKGGQLPACWPQKSVALATSQEYLAEELALNRAHNVPTEYRRKGRSAEPVFTSKKHRTAFERIRGMSDAF